ncbi:MAG: glycosyltransferase family A protein [Acidobacteriota bacterium]
MKGAPKISVVLPVYRGAETLGRAVDSIRGQTERDWELILLDDGSGDDSFERCRELAAGDPRLRAERHPENRGLGAAMATLLGLARGRYVAIQEQDDVSRPDRLERCARVLDADPGAVLVSGVAEWVDFAGERLRLFPDLLAGGGQYPQSPRDMVRYLMVEQCKVVNAGAMFRRRAVDGERVFFDAGARMSVDWQFFVRLAHTGRFWGLPEPVVEVQRDDRRASLTAQKELQFQEARRCLARLLDDFGGDPSSPIDRRLYRRALATQELLEGRYWGGLGGLRRHAAALAHDPTRTETWRSLGELLARGARRVVSPGGAEQDRGRTGGGDA